MLGAAQKLVPLPAGSGGLALKGTVLHVLGVDVATAQAYLDQVRAKWLDIVRTDALNQLAANGTAALEAISSERQRAAFAEQHGLPLPQGVRPTATLDQLMADGVAAYKATLAAVQNATTVAKINATLDGARQHGLDWLVPPDWQPYPETCPWSVRL